MGRLTCALGGVALAAVCVAGAADDGDGFAKELPQFGIAYHDFYGLRQKGPTRLDDLRADLSKFPGLVKQIEAGHYRVVWGAGLGSAAENKKFVLAYPADAGEKGGLVLMADGSCRRMTADEFRKAPLAEPVAARPKERPPEPDEKNPGRADGPPPKYRVELDDIDRKGDPNVVVRFRVLDGGGQPVTRPLAGSLDVWEDDAPVFQELVQNLTPKDGRFTIQFKSRKRQLDEGRVVRYAIRLDALEAPADVAKELEQLIGGWRRPAVKDGGKAEVVPTLTFARGKGETTLGFGAIPVDPKGPDLIVASPFVVQADGPKRYLSWNGLRIEYEREGPKLVLKCATKTSLPGSREKDFDLTGAWERVKP